jgi:hypothetical protein
VSADHARSEFIGQSSRRRERASQRAARGFEHIWEQVASQRAGYCCAVDRRHDAAEQRNAKSASEFGAHLRDPGRGSSALGWSGAHNQVGCSNSLSFGDAGIRHGPPQSAGYALGRLVHFTRERRRQLL